SISALFRDAESLRQVARLPCRRALPTVAASNHQTGSALVTIRAFSRRRVLTDAAVVSAAAILPRASLGADWRPTETVRLIVPAAAGGSTDVMGRLLAAHLQTAWGQSAVVENRSGGGGTIGTAEVVRGKADGHVILVGNPGPNAIAYSIFRNMTYKADQLQ